MNIDISKVLTAGAITLVLGLQGAASVAQDAQSGAERAQNAAGEDRSQRATTLARSGAANRATAGDARLMDEWRMMRGEVVEAEALLRAEVGNGLNPVGSVRDLVLTPDGSEIQYILYETSYPYSFYGGKDGFARYDGVEFGMGRGFDVTLRLEAEDSAGAPEELTLTRDQARSRLVSRIVGEYLEFSGDQLREVRDLLIDKDSGAVRYYVVETDNEAMFGTEPRTIPADRVTIEDDGRLTTALRLEQLDSMQVYDSALL